MAMGGLNVFTRKKTEDQLDPRVRQMDELQRLSTSNRTSYLGPDWHRQAKALYNLSFEADIRPTFRPTVSIPQFQVLCLNESTDLASIRPKVFIVKRDERDDAREKSYQANWSQNHFNNRLLFAEIFSMFAGTAFLQVGFDPWGRNGRGEAWLDWRDPGTVYPDAAAKGYRDCIYLLTEDWMYIDAVREQWPGPGMAVKPRTRSGGRSVSRIVGDIGYGFELPPGPLSTLPMTTGSKPGWDGLCAVRRLYTMDFSVEEVKDDDAEKALKSLSQVDEHGTIETKWKRRFPNGRVITEVEGTVVADGEPWWPTFSTRFPILPLYSMPNLGNYWAPPPSRFSLDLQILAGQMYSQVYENAVRTNNGMYFIDAATGIDSEDFGALPAEVHVINSGSRPPEAIWPNPMPAHMLKMPEILLALQKELQGFTPERQGNSGGGNTGMGVFDSALYQSQFMTRLRSMLLAETVEAAAECLFYTMGMYYQDSVFPTFSPDFILSKWHAIDPDELSAFEFYLDHDSIKPVSQAAMSRAVLAMKQAGMIGTRRALEEMGVPDADAAAQEVEEQEQLAALARIQRRGK